MKRTNPSLQYLAAAASAETTTSSAMFHRPPYRGGGRRRNFSDQKSSEGGNRQFVTGDSHFYAVQDANRRFRPPANRGSLPNSSTFRPRQPYFNSRPNQSYVAQPPLAFDRNQQFRPTQQFRLRPPKPLDYRNWEYAKSMPLPQCERFTVLSYNILADSLATSHRGKLYFHIPRHILDWEWRKKSIVFELGLWSADILCLQEVDRFQDLEEDLKLRGYAGIWKMRTGDPVDGCAIFWHVSRFKLLYEEFIEFDKHGLRNNVAQICVLESKNSNKQNDVSALSESSSDSNKVVICNIHVLYNPKRGEIKLGQIRLLLERAHAVSKLWDDAPVVLCGDFNCTPKSPLYNFILEAKLNLSELPRDKVSGQASAEIHPTRPYIPNTRAPLASEIVQGPNFDDGTVSPSNLFLDMQQKMGVNSNSEDLPLSCSSQPPDTQRDVPTSTCVDEQRKKGNGELSHDSAAKIHQVAKDECKHETELALNVQPCASTKSPINSYCGNKCSVDLTKDKVCEASLLESHPEDILSNETRYREDLNVSSNASCDSHSNYSQSKSHSENENLHSGKNESSFVGDNSCHGAMIFSENASIINKDVSLLEPSPEASLSNASVVSSANWSSLSVGSDKISSPTLNEVESSHEVTSVYSTVDRKMENPSLHEFIEITKDQESLGEDCATFLSELHNTDDGFPSDLNLPGGQQMHPSSDGILDTSAGVDFEPVDMGPIAYDPSTWTPVEIETASGSSECTVMEHPLKLRSTYSEVEDHSRTRESNGEPLVTSYNRCFLGTVDYIWHSEGLQTVKVLAPIPKHAMQWTSGFPTKKWGSDHIALVSELAFTRDTTNPNPQVQ